MKLWLAAAIAIGAVACSAVHPDAGASSTDALVALDDNEILGEIQYGATQRFDLPNIQLGAGDASHYTEFHPVLYAQF